MEYSKLSTKAGLVDNLKYKASWSKLGHPKESNHVGGIYSYEKYSNSASNNEVIDSMTFSSYCMVIDSPGYYELNFDILNCTNNVGIYINASDVILNGEGHLVDGVYNSSSRYGIYIDFVNNVTIYNITLTDWFYAGIYLEGSSKIFFYESEIKNNWHGIKIKYSNNNSVFGNKIFQNWDGVNIEGSYGNKIYGNNVSYNDWNGIKLTDSNYNEIYQNIVMGNAWTGISLSASWNNVIYRNTIVENWEGVNLENSQANNIYENNITENQWNGIYLKYSRNNMVNGNKISQNRYGISFDYSDNNTLKGNTFIGCGILLWDSYNNSFQGDTVNYKPLVYLEGAENIVIDYEAGQIVIVKSSNITIKEQKIENTTVAIELWKTNNTIIANSTLTKNLIGVGIYNSTFNTVYGNNITSNKYGLELIYSNNNTIYLNNFIDNEYQYIMVDCKNNRFYSPIKVTYKYGGIIYENYTGNYWSDYQGTDVNKDGIGDTPYQEDSYPLINMISVSNFIVIADEPPRISILSPSNETVLNTTTVTITWNASDDVGIDHYEIYVNETLIAIVSPNETNYNLTFENSGTYIISLKVIDTSGKTASDSILIRVILTFNQTQKQEGSTYNKTSIPLEFVISIATVFLVILVIIVVRKKPS